MRNGKLNKWELITLKNACDILSDWTEWAENDGMDDGYASGWQYYTARGAVDELREFIDSYEI